MRFSPQRLTHPALLSIYTGGNTHLPEKWFVGPRSGRARVGGLLRGHTETPILGVEGTCTTCIQSDLGAILVACTAG